MCLCDIDWENELIHFPAAKGDKQVHQPLMAEAGNALTAYLARGRQQMSYPEVFLSVTKPAHPLSSSNLSNMSKRRFKRAQIILSQGVSYGTHGFRHALAGRLVGLIPFKELSDMLGHLDPSSTLLYSKVNFDMQQEAALPWPEEELS